MTRTWREMEEFSHMDLEDSWVTSWRVTEEELVVEVEASLWPGHPEYETPIYGNHTCYKPAQVVFPSVKLLEGLRTMEEVSGTQDLDGSIDYGFMFLYEAKPHEYWVESGFGSLNGSIRITSGPPYVKVTKNV